MSTDTAQPGTSGFDELWAPEWWERGRDRRIAWAGRHAKFLKRLLFARLVVAVALVVYVTIACIFVPAFREAVAVYVGVAWVMLLGFVSMRTKTLTFGGYLRFFTACIPWSVGIAATLYLLSNSLSPQGADAPENVIMLAGIGEEALKVVPVALLALAAPGRARRFTAADWFLLALASGGGFLMAEEAIRRMGRVLNGRDLGSGFVRFGLFGVDAPEYSTTFFAGHHIVTGLVGAAIGLGIALWRAPRQRDGAPQVALRTAAVLLPLAAWWSAVVSHASYNASIVTDRDSLPWPFTWWQAVSPDRWGATWMLVTAAAIVLLVDADVNRRWGGAALDVQPEHPWADRADRALISFRKAQSVTSAWGRGLVALIEHVGRAAVQLARDNLSSIQYFLVAAEREDGEPWWSPGRRVLLVITMQREVRELIRHLYAPPARPHSTRTLGGVTALALIAAAVLISPLVAVALRPVETVAWAAGLFDQIDPMIWILAFITAILMAILLFLSGLGLGAALAYGSLVYALPKAVADQDDIIAFMRDPRRALQIYLDDATPASVTGDLAVMAISIFGPARLARATPGFFKSTEFTSKMRLSIAEYQRNPVAYRRATQQWFHDNRVARRADERGHIAFGFDDGLPRINGRRPINYVWANKTYNGAKWTPDLAAKYPRGVPFDSNGFPVFNSYADGRFVAKKQFTGRMYVDAKAANLENGFLNAKGKPETPIGYTWHHVEDGKTLLLVPTDLHTAVKHTGGVAVIK